jgi:hypothetical protein
LARCGGGRPTVEGCLTLDIRELTRVAHVPGCAWSGTLRWAGTNNSRSICQAECRVTFREGTGVLHVRNILCFDPFGKAMSMEGQTVRLVTTTPPYGGRRWWFWCPITGQRVMKLYFPYGARTFASRQAYRLGYAVQRESARAQAYRRARKARKKIGGSSNLVERLPFKPKWMRWATYWRHVDAYKQAERQISVFLVGDAEKILGRSII